MFRVVRPGGWVQFLEMVPEHVGETGRPNTDKLIALMQAVGKARNIYLGCAYNLPKMLADAGFVDIQQEWRTQKIGKSVEEDSAQKENMMELFRGMKTPVLKAGGFGMVSSEAEYDALLEGMDREWEEMPATDHDVAAIWARKPSGTI
uniref:Uncharacterized protein n=1 Tax=Mycena chlorophos TaxID=658473 RepID=A0ABQ0LU74_MYCCL|nr:predicted protein [Mycena chlorophos]